MPRGKPHPPETRANVLAALASGESVSQAAKRFGVSKGTALFWKAQYAPIETEQRTREREEMAGLIYATIADSLSAIRSQLQVVTDKEWIKKQSAGDIAILLGTEFDRTVRLLSGLRPTGYTEQTDAPPEIPEVHQ